MVCFEITGYLPSIIKPVLMGLLITQRLQQLYETIPPLLLALPEEAASTKPHPAKWSKKEILGHLLDSAVNNHTRLIRIQIAAQPLVIEPYAQDDWVRLHQYRQWSLEELVGCWKSHQYQIIRLMEVASSESLARLCDIGEGELKTMQWLYLDYVDHLEHHLHQLVEYDF